MLSDVTCKQERKRVWLLPAILATILLGLLSRSSLALPSIFLTYGGDTLWALMFYFIFACCFPKQSIAKLAVLTLLFSYLIECSQLIDNTFMNAARQGVLRYLLGQGFVWSDLLCYTMGVSVGVILELFTFHFLRKVRTKDKKG